MDESKHDKTPVPLRNKQLLASSLESAQPGQMVALDSKGRVISPRRHRVRRGLAWAAMGAICAGLPIVYTALWGVVGGALVGGGFIGWTLIRVRYYVMLKRAVVGIAAGNFDQEALLLRVIEGRLCSKPLRGAAHLNLGACLTYKGQYEFAREHYERAAVLIPKRSVHRKQAEYAVVMTYVNLEQPARAHEELSKIALHENAGRWMKILHWIAEFYVAHAVGQHSLDDEQLHERAILALNVSTAGELLALLAWAHQVSGDTDQAWHLLREALDREVRNFAFIPRLRPWIDQYRDAVQ